MLPHTDSKATEGPQEGLSESNLQLVRLLNHVCWIYSMSYIVFFYLCGEKQLSTTQFPTNKLDSDFNNNLPILYLFLYLDCTLFVIYLDACVWTFNIQAAWLILQIEKKNSLKNMFIILHVRYQK